MLFSKIPIKIKAGDFVVGVRQRNFERLFDTPTMVLEIKDSHVLVVVNEISQWMPLEEVELVRFIDEEPED